MPTLASVFRSLYGIYFVDSGIVFDLKRSPARRFARTPATPTTRIDLRATLDGARLSLQFDIGFGDAVTPAAQPIAYPTLLPDVPAPTLRLPRARSSPESCMR